MDPRLQDAMGRVKEAAGALTANKDLKESGAADQAAARTAQAIQKATKNAKGAVNDAAEAVKGAIDTTAGKLNKK